MGRYAGELEIIFAAAAKEIERFPAPFDKAGQALLAKSNPLQVSGGTNPISYLLPFWMRELTNGSAALCSDLAIGNIYAMLYFCLLDDLMDAVGSTDLSQQSLRGSLALGELLHNLFQNRYYRYFSADSPLWTYYRKYLEDWASAVSQENQYPADPHDPRQLACKSAPVKLCATGMLLLAGHEDRITSIEEAIDLSLAALQLADDWADWREDLAEEDNNSFLTLVRRQISVKADVSLNERMVKQAVYRCDCLDRLADIAEEYGIRLERIPGVPRGLIAFHQSIVRGLRQDAQETHEFTINLALNGGIARFFEAKDR